MKLGEKVFFARHEDYTQRSEGDAESCLGGIGWWLKSVARNDDSRTPAPDGVGEVEVEICWNCWVPNRFDNRCSRKRSSSAFNSVVV